MSGEALARMDALRLCGREAKEAATLSSRLSLKSRAADFPLGDEFNAKYADLLTREGFETHLAQLKVSVAYVCEAAATDGSLQARRTDGKGTPRKLVVANHPCVAGKVMILCSCRRYAEFRECCRHVFALVGVDALVHPRWLKMVNNLSNPLENDYVESIRKEFDIAGVPCKRAIAIRRVAPFGAQVHTSAPVGDEDGGGGNDGERSEEEQQQQQQQPARLSLSAGAQERDRFQQLNQMGIGRWKIFCRNQALFDKAVEVMSTALSDDVAAAVMEEILGSPSIPPSADKRSTGFGKNSAYSGLGRHRKANDGGGPKKPTKQKAIHGGQRKKRKTTLDEEDDAEFESAESEGSTE